MLHAQSTLMFCMHDKGAWTQGNALYRLDRRTKRKPAGAAGEQRPGTRGRRAHQAAAAATAAAHAEPGAAQAPAPASWGAQSAEPAAAAAAAVPQQTGPLCLPWPTRSCVRGCPATSTFLLCMMRRTSCGRKNAR